MPPSHRLFFALLPPPDARRRLGAVRDALGGGGVADDRLHVTLFATDRYPALPPGLAARAIRAAGPATRTAGPIILDQIIFAREHTLLGASEVPPPLRVFQLTLQRDLKRTGVLPLTGYRFQPHCTLGYGAHAAGTRGIDPIGWTAAGFVLVHSLVGQREYRILGSWPLAGGGP